MLVLQTERLSLLALTREQLELGLADVSRLAAELGIRATEDLFSEESRQAMMIKISRMDHADLSQHPWYTYFLLIRLVDLQAVGVCGFKGPPTMFGSVELGYAMQEQFRNHGYMTEAVRGLVKWAFTHEKCAVVTAETLRENFASQKVLQKAGLELRRTGEKMLYWSVEKPSMESEAGG